MAEEQDIQQPDEQPEEIIIIDEAEAAGVESAEEEGGVEEESSDKKLKLILIALVGVLLTVLLILVAVALFSSDDEAIPSTFEDIDTRLKEKPEEVVETSRLEKMIAKANYLYSSGSKDEALKLFERIAVYSESISQYNLGVAQLKEQQYETALETFKRAIANGDNRCVSAINAAVCSLYLGKRESYDYYIDMAQAYLPYESDSPLYSYYYTLINYYKGNYVEALLALKYPTSEEYKIMQNKIKSQISTLHQDYYTAITALENPFDGRDAFTLGLLYANIGDLTLAKKHLSDAVLQGFDPMNEQLALAYVNLKAGQLEDGGKQLRDLTDMYGEEVYKSYPVKVFLKAALFEPTSAQEQYRNVIRKKRDIVYQKIFYFAPYKVFNAEQTISYIRKGTANIYIDDISSAKEYLQKSSKTSNINYGIAQAIKKSLSFRLRDANEQLQELVKVQPKHSILHYNLGLTFAQLGDMVNAHKHFIRSYHLDASNYLSGIFAIMTSQLTNKESSKMSSILVENLANEPEEEEFELYRTLIDISENNFIGTAEWLNNDYTDRPLYLLMKLHIASELGRDDVARKAAQKLCYQLPNDILPHLLYIDTHFSEQPDKAYAKSVLNYLKEQTFHYDDLYFGPYVSRYLYTQVSLITGKLYPLRMQLKEKLETTTEAPQDIMSALALASIYDQEFEEAYNLYNQIVDDYKIRDAQTLFLGAVASLAAEHDANAIGLLELAKLKDPQFMESRYGLGLLYLRVKNNQGAGIQFQHIGNIGFTSDYFNFMIDTKQLLFERNLKADEARKEAATS
ncbi:MAG: tetratricopeptide repeat protein [Sulfurimonadaceae bacterium]|nr:tetratricopeptide repeat protein [Sulfurimonadaceae bacterium]